MPSGVAHFWGRQFLRPDLARVRPHAQPHHLCAASLQRTSVGASIGPTPRATRGRVKGASHSRSEPAIDAPAGSPYHWASGAVLHRNMRAPLKEFALADSSAYNSDAFGCQHTKPSSRASFETLAADSSYAFGRCARVVRERGGGTPIPQTAPTPSR